MAWRSKEAGLEADAGHDVVMAPKSVSYFDYYQSDDPDEPSVRLRGSGLDRRASRLAGIPAPACPPHLLRLDALGVNYRPLEDPRPWQRGGDGLRKR